MHDRAREWLFPVLALPLALLASHYAAGAPESGQSVRVPITLTAYDEGNLACFAQAAAGRYRCAYRSPSEFARAGSADVLVPVSTTDGRLYLVAGLFSDPAVRARCDRDGEYLRRNRMPPRFTAACDVRLVQQVAGLSLRWNRAQPWLPSQALWAVETMSCKVL